MYMLDSVSTSSGSGDMTRIASPLCDAWAYPSLVSKSGSSNAIRRRFTLQVLLHTDGQKPCPKATGSLDSGRPEP